MATKKGAPRFLLTTIDNPYDPFTDHPRWYAQDLYLGHNTCGLLARFAKSADVFNDDSEVEAMRTIVEYNVSGKHIVVVPTDYDPFLKPELSEVVQGS